MGISDLIAAFLQESLDEAVRRGDLANRFHCVPSQINYVMSTRFSPERGYIVESRRGGNGYIKITRVHVDRETVLMHVINSIGAEIDFTSARAMLSNLLHTDVLDEHTARLLLAVIHDRALNAVPKDARDTVRADILKNALILQV